MASFIQDKIYPLLPVFLQNIGISIFGYTWRKRRFGGVFQQELNACRIREKYSRAEWEQYQTIELRKLLLHSFDTVLFYREKFAASSITRDALENYTLSELKQLPFLTKEDLRNFGESTLISSSEEKGAEFYASSGSTGTPTRILFSSNMHQKWSAAFEARIRNWAGVHNQMARGMIGGRRVVPDGQAKPPFFRYNQMENQVYFSAYHISPNHVANYVSAMWKYKVEYMTGYAVSNYLLALFIQQAGLKAPPMKAVITSSEKLTQEMRTTLEQVYACKVYDGWSGVEACALVSECEEGSLHISEDVGIIEIVDEAGKEVMEGMSGEVVCTGLLNYAQPLIRYKIGDRMTKGIGTCSCGREMPLIKEIDGRIEDVVIGPDGRQMVRFHGIFVGIPTIERGQIIQHALDRIEVKIQNRIPLSEDEKASIQKRMKSQLGNVEVVIEEHASIPQTSNGKFKAVISHLKK